MIITEYYEVVSVTPIARRVLLAKADPRRLAGSTVAIKPPLEKDFPAGTVVNKVPVAAATTPAPNLSIAEKDGSSSGGDSSNLPGSETEVVVILVVAIAGLICLCITAMLYAMKSGKKNTTRATDREAYLKNDFIERQPVYHDAPQPEETDPMIKEEAPMPPPPPPAEMSVIQPTMSFPMQVSAPVTTLSGVPPPLITTAGPSMYAGNSMYANSNYGGSMYAPAQPVTNLGMTTSLTSMPNTSMMYRR
jgi:hypothetical protein